jgi:hypothetical protein
MVLAQQLRSTEHKAAITPFIAAYYIPNVINKYKCRSKLQ